MRNLCLVVAVLAALTTPAQAGLFGSSEYARSGGDSSGRWSGMLTREVAGDPCAVFPTQVAGAQGGDIAPAATALAPQPAACRQSGEGLQVLKAGLRGVDQLPVLAKVERVNSIVNAVPYIADKSNYGSEDYWATLPEFAARGGDCEDYAIAKYMLLKALGVPAESMRVAVVHDLVLDMPHAVLAVDVESTIYILDNQAGEMRADSAIGYYRPVYSINERGWWLHMPD